jgi:hypothetical protein
MQRAVDILAGAGPHEGVERLRFEATVPRRLVHKEAVSEVLLTDSIQVEEDRFLCAAQIPPLHRLYAPVDGRQDLTAVIEAIRQAAELIAHRHLGIPFERGFIFRSIDVTAVDPDATAQGQLPGRLVLDLEASGHRRLGDELASFDLAGTGYIDGRLAYRGSGGCVFLPLADYAELRAAARRKAGASGEPPREDAVARADPGSVRRRDAADVVIGHPELDDDGAVAALVVDRSHRSFFDHEVDHVPGSLLLEAARQMSLSAGAALAGDGSAGWTLTRCAASFGSFAELTAPVHCAVALAPERSAGPAPALALRVRFLQRGAAVTEVDTWLSPS